MRSSRSSWSCHSICALILISGSEFLSNVCHGWLLTHILDAARLHRPSARGNQLGGSPFSSIQLQATRDVTDLSSLVENLGAWVPVGSISCMVDRDPVSIQIMGRNFCVWKTPDDSTDSEYGYVVQEDSCPHRQAPLSQGRIVGRCVECPLHGWQFNATGSLTCIPQLATSQSLPAGDATLSVPTYPTHVVGDLLWTFLPTIFHGEQMPRSLLPEYYYHGMNNFMNVSFSVHEVPFSFDFLIENGLDGPNHAYFAHHGFGFDRAEAGPIPTTISISNQTHLYAEMTYTRKGEPRRRRYGFQRPFLVSNQQPHGDGDWEDSIIFFCIPCSEGKTRMITSFETLRPHPWTPDWMLHTLNQRFLNGDVVMHETERRIRADPTQPSPRYRQQSSSDKSTTAWRQWWKKYGMIESPPHTFGPVRAIPAPIPPTALVDPWIWHTQHCRKCLDVHRRAQKAVRLGGIAMLLSLTILRARRCALGVGLVGALLLGAGRAALGLVGDNKRGHLQV